MEMREGAAEAGPPVYLGEQRGDSHIRHHRVEPIGKSFGFVRRRRLERRDFQFLALDANVLQLIRRRVRGDFGKPSLQERLAFREIRSRGRRRRDRQRPGFAHGGEQRRRDQLLFNGAPLPAAFDPDVAGAQPIAQSQQCRRFPDAAVQLA
jgi:hypothetical protein